MTFDQWQYLLMAGLLLGCFSRRLRRNHCYSTESVSVIRWCFIRLLNEVRHKLRIALLVCRLLHQESFDR